ncbi:MAG TPA: phage tail protein [Kofleriaceae bacterium]|jgi:microcystin-dependent protein
MTFTVTDPPAKLTWGDPQTTTWEPPPQPCSFFTLVLTRPNRDDVLLGSSTKSSIVWDVPVLVAATCGLSLTGTTSAGVTFTATTTTLFAIGGATGPKGDAGTTGKPGTAGPGLPPGTIAAFAGADAPPGWLLCDGTPVSRTEHAALFAAIGDTWGKGDGSTTFVVPDLRGVFLRGADPGKVRDPDVGARIGVDNQPLAGVGSVQRGATAMPAAAFSVAAVGDHHHNDPTTNGQGGPYELAAPGSDGPFGFDYGAQSAPTTDAGGHAHDLAGGDKETRPPNTAVTYLIKT